VAIQKLIIDTNLKRELLKGGSFIYQKTYFIAPSLPRPLLVIQYLIRPAAQDSIKRISYESEREKR
tara:strand:- start:628 stop:825 length:198 start_codon:yes stop_codon:yes gene_type:complete